MKDSPGALRLIDRAYVGTTNPVGRKELITCENLGRYMPGSGNAQRSIEFLAEKTRTSFMKELMGIFLGIAFLASALRAETIKLNFNSLPSAQGWMYRADYGLASPMETNVFRVDGAKLIQNTIGIGPNLATYELTNIIATNAPFTIRVRARVLQSETTAEGGPASALLVYAYTGTEVFGFGLNSSAIAAPYGSGSLSPIDATQFHCYRIEAVPGDSVRIFIDDDVEPRFSGTPPRASSNNVLGLGNASSFENGYVEVTEFVFIQRHGPTVSMTVSCVDVCWDSLSNAVYQVQYRSMLTTNQWMDLGSQVLGTGATNCITDPVLNGPQRFYRVVETIP